MELFVDIGGTNFRYILKDSEVVLKEESLKVLELDVISKLEELTITFKPTFIGISFAGQVDNGVILSAPNIAIKSLNISEYFMQKYGVKVVIENDLKCSALKEASIYKDYKMIVLLSIGTGFGSAYIYNSTLIRGANNLAGEIGHIHYKESPFICGCGKTDCLELFCSGSAIIKWADYLELNLKNFSLEELENHSNSKTILDNFYDSLSYATSTITTILNPDLIVLSGSLFLNNPKLLDFVKESIAKLSLKPSSHPKIVLSTLNNSSIEGAMLLS